MTEEYTDRQRMRQWHRRPDTDILEKLTADTALDLRRTTAISVQAEALVSALRQDSQPGLMEVFLEEYGLSTEEGVALMCLAEALLRVPDADTIDALIEDKIAPSSWGEHLGHSSSSLVNASTWALMLTGRVLSDEDSKGVAGVLHGVVRRLGEPVIRLAVTRAMKELGAQFVLGQSIAEAMKRTSATEAKGFTYSYDMLGEAALTETDADHYFEKYREAIAAITSQCKSAEPRLNPGISIKLSALHPRYEENQRARVLSELVPRVIELALLARAGNMGLNIDAEEADRLDLSLDVIDTVFADDRLDGWDGFGVVVQAYGKRAGPVIDWLYQLAQSRDRRIMVRLVKGAYWDSEIKTAQVEGLPGFPVFTTKTATDVSYICCAEKLLGMTDRIYPQFATHNAHTISAVLELADDKSKFEFQRLHGMGEALHILVREREETACRIYAPVGVHQDLLAYLVRRLLENGANSSFVNQIVDEDVPASVVAADPFAAIEEVLRLGNPQVKAPIDLFAPERANSKGWDVRNSDDLHEIDRARGPFMQASWAVSLAGQHGDGEPLSLANPAGPDDIVGTVIEATAQQAEIAISQARPWRSASARQRADILRRAAELYEENFGEIFAVLCREAGKSLPDAIAELREAVDFLRFYASEAERHADAAPRGIFSCISPWNFPLAIFTGQIAAALAAGNGVLAKPAETTPIIASIAVRLLHEAGVPRDALQLIPGAGRVVGHVLTSDPRIDGVCFTGSTATARLINRAMAENLDPGAPLIAETGGINAMIVDSTALPQQAIADIAASAFQSAGQRCSALRVLYVQEDVAPHFIDMLKGAMDELQLGDPQYLSSDIGPVINQNARDSIDRHIDAARREGRVLKELPRPGRGHFVGPTLIQVESIDDVEHEVFGPVLHVVTFKARELDSIAEAINATGYGLTFGLHTRIDDRVEHLTQRIKAGNLYVNRNQIGAIVGSQPFGGEGLSGTGPKAGGPHYFKRFCATDSIDMGDNAQTGGSLSRATVQSALDALLKTSDDRLSTIELPGPTGESNQLSLYPRGTVLCLGPGIEHALEQARIARSRSCTPLVVAPGAAPDIGVSGHIVPDMLTTLLGIDVVCYWGTSEIASNMRRALAERAGPLVPLVTHKAFEDHCVLERHICVDTTAAGGNATLLLAQ